jgi:hypothetical protein
VEQRAKKLDVLFTHDCSDRTPFGFNLVPDPDSKMHRQKIDRVLRATKPEVHLHGHMHRRYDWMNLVADDHYTQTYGLDCDGTNWNMGVLSGTDFKFIDKGWAS